MEEAARSVIPFAKPWVPEASKRHVLEALESGRIGRTGYYHERCLPLLQDIVRREFILLTNSGTLALQAALAARPEWETIRVPDYTFGATANAVIAAGRKLVLCGEGLPRTHSIHVAIHNREPEGDPALIDSAQRLAADGTGDRCGSFFANKLLTCGEGGYFATNDPDRYVLAKAYIDHGRLIGGYGQALPGVNGHLSDLSAAFLLGQLESYGLRCADACRQAAAWAPQRDRFREWCALIPLDEECDQTTTLLGLRRAGIDARRDFRPLRTLRAFRDIPTEGTPATSYALLLPAWHELPTEDIHRMKELL